MAMLREGDVLVVTKLDRLARSMADLMKILEAIKAAGATLRVLAMGLDTGNATSKLILNVLGSVAEFERELMLERQRAGIAKAKAEGVKQRPEFKKMIDEWLQAYDGGRIVCRQAKVSPSHARECDRWDKDRDAVEDRLRAYLVKEGFDVRDVRELGLWPSSPDGPYR